MRMKKTPSGVMTAVATIKSAATSKERMVTCSCRSFEVWCLAINLLAQRTKKKRDPSVVISTADAMEIVTSIGRESIGF